MLVGILQSQAVVGGGGPNLYTSSFVGAANPLTTAESGWTLVDSDASAVSYNGSGSLYSLSGSSSYNGSGTPDNVVLRSFGQANMKLTWNGTGIQNNSSCCVVLASDATGANCILIGRTSNKYNIYVVEAGTRTTIVTQLGDYNRQNDMIATWSGGALSLDQNGSNVFAATTSGFETVAAAAGQYWGFGDWHTSAKSTFDDMDVAAP